MSAEASSDAEPVTVQDLRDAIGYLAAKEGQLTLYAVDELLGNLQDEASLCARKKLCAALHLNLTLLEVTLKELMDLKPDHDLKVSLLRLPVGRLQDAFRYRLALQLVLQYATCIATCVSFPAH